MTNPLTPLQVKEFLDKSVNAHVAAFNLAILQSYSPDYMRVDARLITHLMDHYNDVDFSLDSAIKAAKRFNEHGWDVQFDNTDYEWIFKEKK